MNKKRETWPFGCYDFNVIKKYINEMADKGYSLEKVGSFFATYEMTARREYKYDVDYVNQFDNKEELEAYKEKWTNKGWDFVDYYDGAMIFRCKNFSVCEEIENEPKKIRENLLLRAKKYDKSSWLQTILWIVLAIANSFIFKEIRIFWIVFAGVQFISLFSLYKYLRFRKNDNNHIYFYTPSISKGKIVFSKYIKWLEKLLALALFIALGHILFFTNKSYFLSKLFIVLVVFLTVHSIYNKVKDVNENKATKFDFESGKGKLLAISIGMIITIGIMYSFILIDQSKPKEDILYHLPRMKVECSDKIYYIEHEYGIWDYEHLNGFGVGSEKLFSLPEISELDKLFDSVDNDNLVKISFLKEPKKIELRYWDEKNFEEIKSYDEGYKTAEIKENTFQFIDEEVIYAVYAEWEEKQYEGFGYYLFSKLNFNTD